MKIPAAFRNVRIDSTAAGRVVSRWSEQVNTSMARTRRQRWADSHRARLIRYGEYVKTSQSTRARLLQIVSRTIPSPDPDDELAALTCHCGRIACRHHQEEP